MKIAEIKKALKAGLLVGEDQLDKNIVVASGRLYINGLRGVDGSW